MPRQNQKRRKQIAEMTQAVNAIMAHVLVNAPAAKVSAFTDGVIDGETARVRSEHGDRNANWHRLGYGLGIARNAAHDLLGNAPRTTQNGDPDRRGCLVSNPARKNFSGDRKES